MKIVELNHKKNVLTTNILSLKQEEQRRAEKGRWACSGKVLSLFCISNWYVYLTLLICWLGTFFSIYQEVILDKGVQLRIDKFDIWLKNIPS